MFFFFFKQKTAYEMRISDWSSDVCSSDLVRRAVVAGLEIVINRRVRQARYWFQKQGYAICVLMDVHQLVARVDVGHEAVPPPELTSHPQRHLIVHEWDVYCALDSFIFAVAVGQSALADRKSTRQKSH